VCVSSVVVRISLVVLSKDDWSVNIMVLVLVILMMLLILLLLLLPITREGVSPLCSTTIYHTILILYIMSMSVYVGEHIYHIYIDR
jgi:hypothetical protein